jgi:hypothetical protein
MRTTVLGISGVRGSGKSLLGLHLTKYGFERISLASWLKQEAVCKFGLTSAQVYGTEKETPTQYVRTDGSPLTGRDILIRMGVFYRSIDPLWFCKKLEEEIKPNGKYVIDDIRFVNEINFFKDLYRAKFVRIERLPELNVYKAALDDLSETELNNQASWDWVLPAELNKTSEDLAMFASVLNASLSI